MWRKADVQITMKPRKPGTITETFMPIRRRTLLAGAALAMPFVRRADAANTIKIGVLSDMSGRYAEASDPGDYLAARMAAEDFMKLQPGITVEVVQIAGGPSCRTWENKGSMEQGAALHPLGPWAPNPGSSSKAVSRPRQSGPTFELLT